MCQCQGPDIIHAVLLAWITGTPKLNGAIINIISYTWAFPTMTSQNVCREKVYFRVENKKLRWWQMCEKKGGVSKAVRMARKKVRVRETDRERWTRWLFHRIRSDWAQHWVSMRKYVHASTLYLSVCACVCGHMYVIFSSQSPFQVISLGSKLSLIVPLLVQSPEQGYA